MSNFLGSLQCVGFCTSLRSYNRHRGGHTSPPLTNVVFSTVYVEFFSVVLQTELVANCELEYGVLAVKSVYQFGKSPVVACVEDEIGELVGQANRNGEVETLYQIVLYCYV